MLQHARVRHRRTSAVQNFIGLTPSCPVCHKMFSTRLRAIAHLSETRVRGRHGRPTCNSILFSSPLSERVVEPMVLRTALAVDRDARRNARRNGHSVPVVGLGGSSRGPKSGTLTKRPERRASRKCPERKVSWVWSTIPPAQSTAPKRRLWRKTAPSDTPYKRART